MGTPDTPCAVSSAVGGLGGGGVALSHIKSLSTVLAAPVELSKQTLADCWCQEDIHNGIGPSLASSPNGLHGGKQMSSV